VPAVGGPTYQFIEAKVRLSPVLAGKHRIGTIKATKALAIHPIGMLSFPKFQGPGRKRLPTKKTLMKMGVVKATKAASAPILKMAPMARLPPKIRRSRQHPTALLNQTALTGVWVTVLTCFQYLEKGKQPSYKVHQHMSYGVARRCLPRA